ncbi:hypothetical protein [Nocardioides sp.]|uniref:hypothetical protein n=1 Tax=Nocardioides sp. TaxID=35761 RepID=UPI00261E117A|nr:hypothetical protein [Nocardioides sp.]MDI6909208.1 hypothetical protein [Nocardioides sp.]
MRRRLAAAAAATLAVAALASQLVIPSVAEDRLRDRLATVGAVSNVDVSATPAVKMLFGSVDRAAVEMYDVSLDGAADLDPEMIARLDGVQEVDARIDRLRAGPIDVDEVRLIKDGDSLEASGDLDLNALKGLIPGVKVSVKGGSILLDLSESGLPLPFPVQLEIVAEDGAVVARPLGAAAAMLPAQPLLERPELSVQDLRAEVEDGRLTVAADARLT